MWISKSKYKEYQNGKNKLQFLEQCALRDKDKIIQMNMQLREMDNKVKEYQRMYADEAQKRLELLAIIDSLKKGETKYEF